MRRALAVSVLLLALGADLQAQHPVALELRFAGDVPTRDIGDVRLGTGFGFEASARYRFHTHLAAYGGWDWVRFESESASSGAAPEFVETGWVFGLRYEHRFRGGGPIGDGWAWWARAGGTWSHVEVEGAPGPVTADTGHGPGWEAAAGVEFGFGEGWSLTPGIRYRAFSGDVDLDGISTDVDLRYVAFGIGFNRTF